MKHLIRICVGFCLACLAGFAVADISLPQPQQTGGEGIFKTLKDRRSVTKEEFPLKEISLQELSNVLWAAIGQNRDKPGWTIPLSGNKGPYNTIYVLNKDGVYQYDSKNNKLILTQKRDLRALMGTQSFVKDAPVVLAFTSNNQAPTTHAYIAAGAMSQNIYLASASMQLKTRFIMAMIDEADIKKALKLNDTQYPTNIMILGK